MNTHPRTDKDEQQTAADHLEVEWQYETPDPQALKDRLLAGNLGDFRVSPEKTARIHDTYLDTPDLRILRAGYALRIRSTGGRTETSLKELAPREGGLAMRREISQPLASSQKAALFEQPGPVADRLRLLCRQEDLRSLAILRTERQAFSVAATGTGEAVSPGDSEGERDDAAGDSGPEGPAQGTAPTAEIALDRTFLTDPLGRTHRLARVEVEVAEEDISVFRPLAERMRSECSLLEAAQSKFQWALEAHGIRADRRMSLGSWQIVPSMTVGQLADAVLRRHLASFLWHEPGTRLGEDPGHLHDMRVACRRIRAALKLFRRAWPGEEADDLRRRLGDVGRGLGEVRDLDVLMEHLRGRCGALLSVGASGCAPILDHLAAERERAREKMVASLDSEGFAALVRDLLAAAHRGAPEGRPEADMPILRFAPRKIRRARRRVLKLGDKLTPDSPASRYHEVRIRAKRLRYTLEFHTDVYDGTTRELIAACVEIQDLLGLHQDAQVTVRKLREIVSERPPGFPAEGWTALGELAQAFHFEAAELRRGLPHLLRRLRGKRWRALERRMKESAADAKAAAERDAAAAMRESAGELRDSAEAIRESAEELKGSDAGEGVSTERASDDAEE